MAFKLSDLTSKLKSGVDDIVGSLNDVVGNVTNALNGFVQGITNAVGAIGTLSGLGSVLSVLTDNQGFTNAPSDFPVPDLANNGNTGHGFIGAGAATTRVPRVSNQTPLEELLASGITPGTWEALDFVLTHALNNMDWRTKNADPGNENIVEAYSLAGRTFTRDGGTGELSWAGAFATWALAKSGFSAYATMASMNYTRYGNPIRFEDVGRRNVRKWDLVVFNSNFNIQHVGFIQDYDPSTRTAKILGGDQGDRLKITEMPISITDPVFRLIATRRNWNIPASIDKPLWELNGRGYDVLPFHPVTAESSPPVKKTYSEQDVNKNDEIERVDNTVDVTDDLRAARNLVSDVANVAQDVTDVVSTIRRIGPR